jgi:condensin complex subunit 3
MQILEAEESDAVQAVICLGFAKLMLYGLVVDERVIEFTLRFVDSVHDRLQPAKCGVRPLQVLLCLVMAYVSPMTAANQELRQCLAYFLPVYCYSSAQNQDRMRVVSTICN